MKYFFCLSSFHFFIKKEILRASKKIVSLHPIFRNIIINK